MSAGASSSSNIVFLENRTKERREDRRSGEITILLHARSLIESSGAGQECWNLSHRETTSSVGNIETAELKKTHRFHVKGAISMRELTPGVLYEVVYEIKLKRGGCGWEHPVTLTLSVPGERARSRRVNFYELPKGEWIEVKVGEFKTRPGETRQVSFELLQDEAHDKKGLVLKSAIVRPKT
ncbi:lectin-like isoform X1 [Vitis riparia]|uniref:lectin-like isoform X1 n=1 Tax=Vitis riparia TaxID=96939 RepID=UPI00155A5C33|nr:lectin-like isoform X1 [Vitis riparia]